MCLSAVKEAGATQVETTREAEIGLVEALETRAAGMIVAMTGVQEADVAEANFAEPHFFQEYISIHSSLHPSSN